MSDNVGLSTPRGSGTSGYVQRNLAHLRPRDNRASPYAREKDFDSMRHVQRKPDQGILEHDRKREVEVKVFELRDKLEEEGVDEEEIDTQCDALRKKLLDEMERKTSNVRQGGGGGGGGGGGSGLRKQLKSYQVHELADAKIKESERLRQALRISKDYEEGGHWRKQEERLKKALERDVAPGPAPTAPLKDERDKRERDDDDVDMDRERDRDKDFRREDVKRGDFKRDDSYSDSERSDGGMGRRMRGRGDSRSRSRSPVSDGYDSERDDGRRDDRDDYRRDDRDRDARRRSDDRDRRYRERDDYDDRRRDDRDDRRRDDRYRR